MFFTKMPLYIKGLEIIKMPIKVNEAIMNKFDFDIVDIQSYS